jgi:hypothetical protein
MGQVKYLALILCGFTTIITSPLLTHQSLFYAKLVKSVPYLCLNRALKYRPHFYTHKK